MTRVLVYSFATLMDVVLSAVLFVNMVRLAEMGVSSLAVSGVMSMWAAVYMISSLAAGQIINRRRAGWILIGACFATILLAIGFIAAPGIGAVYFLMGLQGCAAAMFFTPFQVFMKFVDEGQKRGICHSVGLYTFAWSTGFALGPFIAGFMWQRIGWRGIHVFDAVLCLGIMIGVYLLKHHAEAKSASVVEDEQEPLDVPDAHYASAPDLAWMSWVFGGIGCLIASLLRSVFPSSGALHAIPRPDQGIVLFLFCGVQAVVGLSLGRSRSWMYRPLPILAFGLCGVCGLGLFALARTSLAFYLAAACFGIYSGSMYFYFVFHSLVHPTRRARYVSINEAVVGLASTLGPSLGGAVADRFGLPASYLTVMAMLAFGLIVQAFIHASQAAVITGPQGGVISACEAS